MQRSDVIGLLIVAVVALGGVAFMVMGSISAPQETVAGQAIQFTGPKMTPRAASSVVDGEAISREDPLRARTSQPGLFLSAGELQKLLRSSDVNGKTGQEVCQSLGFRECNVVFGQDIRWYYESTDGGCDGLQYIYARSNLIPCNSRLSWADLDRARFSEPNTACENAAGREPHAGDSKAMFPTVGILCQK